MPSGLQRGTSVDLKNTVLFLKTRELSTLGNLWMALRFGEGNLNATINKQYDLKKSRGRLDDIRRGDEQPLNVSFEGKFTFMLSNYAGEGSGPEETYSLHEILEGVEYGAIEAHGQPKFAGTRESWLNDFGCPPYCCDIEIHNNFALDCPDSLAVGEAHLLRYFRATSIAADFNSGMVNVSGEAHILRPMVMRCAGPAGASPGGYPLFPYTTEKDAVPFFTEWPDDPRTL